MALIEFLDLDLPAADLAAALRVLRAYKGCEAKDDWVTTMPNIWVRLDQLQGYLEHRVEGAPLSEGAQMQLHLMAQRDGRAP